jgi:hypothetical protein
MVILDRPPADWKRPSIPLGAKVQVLLRLVGFGHFDHRPALWERRFDTETNDTIPPANDPNAIEFIPVGEHDIRTHGPGGEKRITTAGSDSNRRAKGRRLETKWREFTAAMAAKVTGSPASQPDRRKRKIPNRPFPKTKRKLGGRRG